MLIVSILRASRCEKPKLKHLTKRPSTDNENGHLNAAGHRWPDVFGTGWPDTPEYAE